MLLLSVFPFVALDVLGKIGSLLSNNSVLGSHSRFKQSTSSELLFLFKLFLSFCSLF
jgi:hypothetical protein